MQEGAPKNEGLSPRVQAKLEEIKRTTDDFDTVALRLNKYLSAKEVPVIKREKGGWEEQALQEMDNEYKEFSKGELSDLIFNLYSLKHADKRNYR